MRRVPTVLAAAATTLLLAATPAVAHGGGTPEPRPPTVKDVTGGLVGPLSLAVGPKGLTYVSQDFAGALTSVARDGTATTIHTAEPGYEVGGVSYGDRRVVFTETFYGENPTSLAATVKTLRTDRSGRPVGSPTVLADIHAFETANNPDGGTSYGLLETDPACVAQVPPEPVPAVYTGVVDAHPYATTSFLGTTYVADAGANAIFAVDRRGVRTVGVLPAQPYVITEALAAEVGWPACTVGETYWFESVPTDVEVGPWGQLYVSVLPGGPEDPSLGGRGVVYRMDPWRGAVRQVATGFVGATDLAVTEKGTVYVAEMFGGKISVVERGGLRTLVEVPLPGAVEWTGKGLVATTNVLPGEGVPPDGRVTTVTLGKTHGHGGWGGWGSWRDDWKDDRHGLGGWFDRGR
ncbi:ScyD/ScyE family protein [Cellulosimicrobium sp. Marseille-Q8652]